MKKFLVLVFCLISTFTHAKDLPNSEYTQIIEHINLSKPELFNKTKEWIAVNFNSSKDVIQYENEVDGKLIAKGVTTPVCDQQTTKLQCFGYSQAKISFSLTVDIQNHRARMKFENLGYALHANAPLEDSNLIRLGHNSFKNMVQNFKEQMQKEKSDQW